MNDSSGTPAEGAVAITAQMIEAEIHALHGEFERCFWGQSSSLDRVENALAEDFLFVGTNGRIVPRAEVLAGIRSASGSYEGPEAFSIDVSEVRMAWRQGGLVSATYQEIQHFATSTTSRQSSVVFSVDSSAPAGLRWMSVHETWLVPPPE